MRRARIFAQVLAVPLAGLLLASTATATSRVVVSKRYGYEFAPGNGFYARPESTQRWHGEFPAGHDFGVDFIGDLVDRKFIVAALNVPASMSLSEWEAEHVARMQGFCKRAHAFRRTTLGGGPAGEFTLACPEYDVIALTAIHARRGYIFQFVSPTALPPAADRHVYEAARRTFRFIG